MKSAQTKQQLFDDLREILKTQADTVTAEPGASAHPDADELASFFTGKAGKAATAAHVAACQSCAEEVALFARAERAAADFQASKKHAATVPAAAWQMIRDWQNDSFAKPKPQTDTVDAEIVRNFARLIADRKAFKAGRKAVTRAAPNQVPVIVVNREGEFRGIELFEKSESKGGEITLKHADPSGRFDNRELHALLHQGRK
jgi:hypothetical protein